MPDMFASLYGPSKTFSCLFVIWTIFPSIFAQAPSNVSTLPLGSCTVTIPCSNGACCNSQSGFCGFGPSFCTTVAKGGPCTSHCDALAECGPFAAADNRTCPLNVCCSQFGFCGTTEEFCGTDCQSNCNPPGQLSCGDDQQTALHRRIGYYEGWAVQSSSRACNVYPPESISAETFTHINFAFALISGTFQIIEMTPGDTALWIQTTNLKTKNAALKVFLSIGGWTFNDPPTNKIFSNLVSSATNINTFIASALNTLQAYGFDGIDIDWEYPAAGDRGGIPSDKANFPIFMSKLKAAFAPRGYGLTFTAPSSYWYLQHFDLPALLRSADWVNVMTYDLHGIWDGQDPYIGKVVLAHTNLTEIKQTMQLYANVGVDPSQIVLGIGFYGRSFQLASSQCATPGCRFLGGASPGICSHNSGTLMFSEIETIIAGNALEPVFDDIDAVKYIVWNKDQWVSYDDAQTLQMKLSYANSICLGGTMVWSVDQDDTSYTALRGLYADVEINSSSFNETGNECRITGCGQGCPANYESLTTLIQNPTLGVSCHTKTPARLCCPVGNAPQSCTWRGGGGHVCNAHCNVGEIVMAMDEVGDGKTPICVQGFKAFCCLSGQGHIGDCFGGGCGRTTCVSGYGVQTFVKQGSRDNGGCESEGPPVKQRVCPEICPSANKPLCCQEGFGYSNCGWVGEVPDCFNAVCPAGQVAIFQDLQGDAPSSCVGGNRRTYCCDPPLNAGFLPVPENWIFPQFSPINGDAISESATFTVDFDDNTGTADASSSGAGSSGESDDRRENDSPFGEIFISSPNPGSVSSLDIASDWVVTNCLRSSDQPQTVFAYCSKPMDDPETGCGHVFIASAQHTIVRMPKTCGLGPYARLESLEVHPNQSVLSLYHSGRKPASELVYALSFDYNFLTIPPENGPIMMRADVTDMPGYWDAMVNSPPDAGTKNTRRKRDFHRPIDLDKRWFGPFDNWLQRLNTFNTGNSLERNFHWSDTYTIFHQEEQCPHFSSSLDISVSGFASIDSAFGYYLEATIVPPAIQQCYVYFKTAAGAEASFTITGAAEAHFNSERVEIATFGFPGLYYPGLLTLGPSLHLYGQLTGELSMGGRFSTAVGYQFPSIDMAFGKQDSDGTEGGTSDDTSPQRNIQGYDYSLAANVNLEGNAEVHLVPSLQLGLNVLGGTVMDVQDFTEADLYAGVSVNGSVSLTSAAKICINPHYGVKLNAGLTGSVLFWNTNPISNRLYSADFSFGDKCFTSFTEPSGSGGSRKREQMDYGFKVVASANYGTQPSISHASSQPAYLEKKTFLSPTINHGDVQFPTTSWDITNGSRSSHQDLRNHLTRRGGVPFLPGNILCPETNDEIDNNGPGKDCSIYANDPSDLDPHQLEDRLSKRMGFDFDQSPMSNLSSVLGVPLHRLITSDVQSCHNLEITLPNYQRTTVSAYYDLASPGTFKPAYKAYNPLPPVSLGQTAGGNPRLATASGTPVYAREHVYEASLAGLFVDYLEQSTDLWRDSTPQGNDWCTWVKDNLVNTPAYFSSSLDNPNAQSVFDQLGHCYPSNEFDSMPIMEQEGNKAKNLAMYDGERQLNHLGTKQFRDPNTSEWKGKCSAAKVAVLRSAAGVISYMNQFPVKNEFLDANRCVRRVWSSWNTSYLASNVDAPNRTNVNVPNLYDNWINKVIAGMAPWLKSEVDKLIRTIADDTIDLSFNVVLDNANLLGQVQSGVTHTSGNKISQAILTNEISNQIGSINWLSSLPTH